MKWQEYNYHRDEMEPTGRGILATFGIIALWGVLFGVADWAWGDTGRVAFVVASATVLVMLAILWRPK